MCVSKVCLLKNKFNSFFRHMYVLLSNAELIWFKKILIDHVIVCSICKTKAVLFCFSWCLQQCFYLYNGLWIITDILDTACERGPKCRIYLWSPLNVVTNVPSKLCTCARAHKPRDEHTRKLGVHINVPSINVFACISYTLFQIQYR